jgi:DNA-binding SARP family transcriptional activator
VTGPAGSGKTTLVASYLEKKKLARLWYQVDQADSDIATFFYYMGLAGINNFPSEKIRLPFFTPEYALGISAFTRKYFEVLFAQLKKPSVLVLDNYQEIPPDSLLHEVIRACLAAIPRKINVIILSRTAPSASLAAATANNLMDIINWQDICLRIEETKGIVWHLSGKEHPDAVIDELHQKAGGWAAGLLLLLKSRANEKLEYSICDNFTPEEIFDYFAGEILKLAEPEVKQFLYATAIFPRMTPMMAERLTGDKYAKDTLSRLYRDHWFTDRRLGQKITYEYHPLFREFLLAKAEKNYSKNQLTKIKNDAGRILESDGHIESAVSLYHEVGDEKNMIRVILTHAQDLIFQGRHQTLEQWLGNLPDEILNKEPWLLYWLGACKTPATPVKGRELFEKALSIFEKNRDVAGIFLALCGVLDSITFSFQSFDLFDQWILKISTLCKSTSVFPSPEIEARLTFSMLHALTMRQPQHPEYERWEQQALLYLQSNVDANAKLQLLLPLLIKRIFSGQLKEAEILANTYQRLTKSPAVTPLSLITFTDLKAFCYWLSGKFADCNDAITEALELSSEYGVHSIDSFLHAHCAAGALSLGDLALADKLLQMAETNLERAGAWGKALFHTMATWRNLLNRNFDQADIYSELAVKWALESGSPQTIAACYLGRSLSLHACGEYKKASEHLAQAFANSSQIRALQEQFTYHLARAEFSLEHGDEATLVESLINAMSLGRQQGYQNAYFWRSEVMIKLCCEALQREIEVEYVQDLIRKRKLISEEPPLDVKNWPWQIKIFTLGRFVVLKNDRPIEFSVKAQKKPLAMLQALIACGVRDVPEVKIADILWPDADGDLAHRSFATTLHRLRKLIGTHDALSLSNKRLSLNSGFCWVDAQAFEFFLEQAEIESSKAEINDKGITLFKKALELYQGHFLDTELDAWNIETRERLKSKYLRAVERFGSHLESTGQTKKAIELYHRAADIEPLAENIYCRLMLALKNCAQHSKAIAVYERCRAILENTLDATPSKETESIYKSLVQ